MSIHSRGGSHRVVVKIKGVVVYNKSFADLAEANRVHEFEQAKLLVIKSKSRLAASIAMQPTDLRLMPTPEVLIALDGGLSVVRGGASIATALPSPVPAIGGPIVATLLETYRTEVSAKHAGKMQEESRLKVFGQHPLARRTVASLTRGDFIAYQSERLALGRIPDTVNREIGMWKSIFKQALNWKTAWPKDEWGNSFNPASIPMLENNEPRDIRLSPDEEVCLLKHAAQVPLPWLPIPIRLCLEINFRRGELLRMKRKDINWQRRKITLHSATVKNRKARDVPLTSRTIAILREAIEVIPADNAGRVFPADDAYFSRQYMLARKAAVKEMPSIEGFRLHDTRHETISRMAKKVPNTVVLAKITGHRSTKSLARYVNLSSEELADMLE